MPDLDQININITDTIPPDNFATVDAGSKIGTVYTKEQDNAWRKEVENTVKSGIVGVLKPNTPYDPVNYPFPKLWKQGDSDLYEKYDVNEPGIFPSAKDANGNPISISTQDISMSEAQIWITNGVADKVLKTLPQASVNIRMWEDIPLNAFPLTEGEQVIKGTAQFIVDKNQLINYDDIPGESDKWRWLSGDFVQNITNISQEIDPSQIVPSEALYNDASGTVAVDIVKRVDIHTGEDVNYIKTTTWLDGTPMDDTKKDNVVYMKWGVYYYKLAFNGSLNVRRFGAKGDGSDDTAAFAKVIDFASKYTSGVEIYVPQGTYVVDANIIKLKDGARLVGDFKSSIIKGSSTAKTDSSKIGVQINGNGCSVEGIYVRDFYTGIKWDTKNQVDIRLCTFSYNVIGVYAISPYIGSLINNYITFNRVGVVVMGESYEYLIKDNVIDNNVSSTVGGLGVYLEGSIGVKLYDNTIEGNRNLTTGIGCGVYFNGLGTAFVADGNWFETNYNPGNYNDYSTDFYLASLVDDAFQTTLKSSVLLPELQTLKGANGSVTVKNSFHYQTKNAVVISGFNYGVLKIEDGVYTGRLTGYNRPIFINLKNAFYETKIEIKNVNVQNTVNASTVNAEMFTGIKKTAIHGGIDNNTGTLSITLDGKDLFTYESTLDAFISKFGAVMTSNFELGLNSRVFKDKIAFDRFTGVTKYSGTVYLWSANLLDALPDFGALMIISDPNGGGQVTTTQPSLLLNPAAPGLFKVHKIPKSNITSSGIFHASTVNGLAVYGYCVFPNAILTTDLQGVRNVLITDFKTSKTVSTEPLPLAANRLGVNGDIVMNSSNTGGYINFYQNGAWQNIDKNIKTGSFTVAASNQTVINIPHGLGAVPSYSSVIPKSTDANTAGIASITEDATNIVVTLKTTVASGSLVYNYSVK